MSHVPNTTVANGVLDRNTGQFVARDATLEEWLGDRSLSSLLPDLPLNLTAETVAQHTKLCRLGQEPEMASVEFTRIDGEYQNWLLLRIETLPFLSNKYHDVVTNLPDRRALESHRARWRREFPHGRFPHAVLFLDLDNFKRINDELGHVVGDQVLSALAARWRKSLRGEDLIVRYGGDEFVAIVAGVHSLQETQPIVDRLRRVTAETLEVNSQSLEISVTIGVALAESVETPLDELLLAADKAMYAAKRAGQ